MDLPDKEVIMKDGIFKSHNVASLLLAAALLLLGSQIGRAKTITAASCNFADVNNAVAQASVGDIVQLPAGTSSWNQTLTLNGVSLQGAGTNVTKIIDEEPRSGGAQLIMAYPSSGSLTEISQIQFCGGVTNTGMSYNGSVSVYGVPGSSWRVDHNIFNALYSKGIAAYGNAFAVIDDNTFYERAISIADNSAFPNDGQGDISYSQPPTYGLSSSNVLYIENNFMTNIVGYVASVGACDGCGGARMVFRYNTVWDDCFNNHGTETGGRVRGERSFEIYGNTFNFSPNDSGAYPCFAAMLIRSGGGVIFSNKCTGYSALVALRNFRSTDSFCGEWDPFCGANGTSPYDSNSSSLYLSGVSSGPSGSTYLQVSDANWTPNQWVGYTLMNVNSGLFSVVLSNTANTMTYIGSTSQTASLIEHSVMTFNPGDPFQLHMVYAALDQPGRGSGNLLQDQGLETSGTLYNQLLSGFASFLAISQTGNGILVTINTATGVPSWPNEALDPIYSWENTINGSLAEMSSPYPGIQQGRDFYNDTPKPGYTPYIYPHPLDLSTNSSSGGNNGGGGNGNTNTNTGGLQPPSNLQFKGSTN
jgi:hypothetical protein